MKIQLSLKPIWWSDRPKVKILLDDDELFNGEIEKDLNLEFVVDETNKEKSNLDICLYDKSLDQTVVEGSTIVKDQLLEIQSVVINDINLDYLIFSAIYTPEYPKHMLEESLVQKKELPTTLTKIDTLGFNGTWRLEFTHPFHLWYLENLP